MFVSFRLLVVESIQTASTFAYLYYGRQKLRAIRRLRDPTFIQYWPETWTREYQRLHYLDGP